MNRRIVSVIIAGILSLLAIGAAIQIGASRETASTVGPASTPSPTSTPHPVATAVAPTATPTPAAPTPTPTPAVPTPVPSDNSFPCGLSAAAFCDGFDERATSGNRNGDLTSAYSVSRWRGQIYPDPGTVGRAAIPACRAGASANPLPPGDVLVCDPSASIASSHALIATAEQNYGDTIARIAQPFDIAGRTGVIRFDTNPTLGSVLLGWPILLYTADPYSALSYLDDNSAGATPRQGVAVHFNGQCNGGGQWNPAPRIRVHDNHAETLLDSDSGCDSAVSVQDGRLNRVEIRISTSHIEVWMSDASSNGVNFGPLKKMFSSDLDLDFDRGNLYIGVHNHATQKYSGEQSWTTYWDNVGFDGPELPTQGVSQVNDNTQPDGNGVNLGYELTDGAPISFTVNNVSTNNTTSARLTFNMLIDRFTNNLANSRVRYRINNNPWHETGLSAQELALAGSRSPTFSFSVPINQSELVNGTNTITFDGANIYAGIQPFIANIDLITN